MDLDLRIISETEIQGSVGNAQTKLAELGRATRGPSIKQNPPNASATGRLLKAPRAQPITGKNSLRGSLVLSGSVRDLTHYPSGLNRKRAEREVDFSKETNQTVQLFRKTGSFRIT